MIKSILWQFLFKSTKPFWVHSLSEIQYVPFWMKGETQLKHFPSSNPVHFEHGDWHPRIFLPMNKKILEKKEEKKNGRTLTNIIGIRIITIRTIW